MGAGATDKNPPTLWLASASRARAMLLENAGLSVRVRPSGVDEDGIKSIFDDRPGKLGECAMALAEAKAGFIDVPSTDFVIGADQILELDGRRFDKPASLEEARASLRALRGRTHRLLTAVCVVQDDRVLWRRLEAPAVTMRSWSDAFLDRYLEEAGEAALASVGGYQLEGLGAQLMERVEGDFFSVLGLPLLPLLAFLRETGAASI